MTTTRSVNDQPDDAARAVEPAIVGTIRDTWAIIGAGFLAYDNDDFAFWWSHKRHEWAEALPRWLNEPHLGDCCKVPMTCMRCVAERIAPKAMAIAAMLGEQQRATPHADPERAPAGTDRAGGPTPAHEGFDARTIAACVKVCERIAAEWAVRFQSDYDLGRERGADACADAIREMPTTQAQQPATVPAPSVVPEGKSAPHELGYALTCAERECDRLRAALEALLHDIALHNQRCLEGPQGSLSGWFHTPAVTTARDLFTAQAKDTPDAR